MMKKTTRHLPKGKRDELRKLVSIIRKSCHDVELDDLGLSTHARIIAHDIQYLNIQLAEGQYFFADIKKEGCLMYDSGNFKLAKKRKLKPNEEKRIAQDYYDDWFESAKDFWFMFEKCFETKRYKKAAFNLHEHIGENGCKT